MDYGLLIFLLGTVVMVVVATTYLLRQREQMQNRIAGLERQLGTFTEASINVARTLDEYLLHPAKKPGAVHCARRYLLTSAQRRIASGAALAEVAVELGLTRDETQLMRKCHSVHSHQQAA